MLVCESTRETIFGDFAVQVGILDIESDILVVVRLVEEPRYKGCASSPGLV